MISSSKQAEAAVGKECIDIPAGGDPSYRCFVGARLVGSSTATKFVNGGRYVVTFIGAERIGLKDEMSGDEFETTPEAISKHCLLAWAMVYNKVQGATETGTVMLHDTGSPYFKKCHLYVGLSRSTDGSHVFVARD